MEATLGVGPTGPMITVMGSKFGAEKEHIFASIVRYCCEKFATSDLREIVRQVGDQMKKEGGQEDIPPRVTRFYEEVVEELSIREANMPAPSFLDGDLSERW